MPEEPQVLVMHEAPHGDDVSALIAAIESRRPDVDLVHADSYAESRELIVDAEIVITRELSAELLDAAESLEWVQALNAGVDSYDLDRLQQMDVALTNAAGVHAIPAGEQVLGYMIVFERRLHRGLRQQSRREWHHYTGGELHGKTVGVVGVGSIGGRVAELTSALGMTVVGTKRRPEDSPDHVDEIYGPDDLHQVLGQSDYVVVTCPLTSETRGLFGPREFSSMRADGVLVNVGRGPVVQEDALATALQTGKLRGAALDVQETEPLPRASPLWDHTDVILTPHMAGSTPQYLERCGEIFAENYAHYLDGEPDAFRNRIV